MMDSDSDLVGKGIGSVPKFDGKKESFPKWLLVFGGYAASKGFAVSLKETTSGLPVTQATRGSTEAEKKRNALAVKQNAIAIAALALAFQDSDTLISYIQESMDDEWPQGVAWKVMALVESVMINKNAVAKLEIQQDLREVSMKDDDDPTVLIEQLSKIKNKAMLIF
jgi:hypothetical protein